MNRKALFRLLTVALSVIAGLALAGAQTAPKTVQPGSKAAPVAIPFDLVTRHIVLQVKVNNSRPLSFIFDTGDKYAIIDLDRAKELGLKLAGQVKVGGAGAGTSAGAYVRDSSFTIPGLEGFSQPVHLAIPVARMAPRFGQDFDGIIGADFIKEFVLEVDYEARLIKLHDKKSFSYSGNGESIPLKLNSAGHPIIEAEVTPIGSSPIKEKFVVDLGSGGALVLHSPFVAEHRLLGPNLKTIKALGAGGAGGQISGQIGRVTGLKIGSFKIQGPITLFSEDKAGAFATSAIAGNIGAQIMSKFRIFLDYTNNRMILEPNSTFAAAFDRAYSGLSLKAEGSNYRTFRVTDVLENSPASEIGMQVGDVIHGIDGRPAADFTLTKINELFEKAVPYKLRVLRSEQTIPVTLTPRKMI